MPMSFVSGANYLGAFAWAARPSASASGAGAEIRVTDLGVSPGGRFISDGTRWVPYGPQVLARSGAPISLTGTTTPTSIVSVTIPADCMGLNGSLRCDVSFGGISGTAAKNCIVVFGGTTFLSSQFAAANTWQHAYCLIQNRNSAASQVGERTNTAGWAAPTSSSGLTGTVNTATDQTFAIQLSLVNTADTVSVERYVLELLP